MRPDYIALHHQYRAKNSGQSRAEYATAIQGYRRPASWKSWALRLIAAGLLIAAVVAGSMP